MCLLIVLDTFHRSSFIYQIADTNNPTPTPHAATKSALRIAVLIEYFVVVHFESFACNFEPWNSKTEVRLNCLFGGNM